MVPVVSPRCEMLTASLPGFVFRSTIPQYKPRVKSGQLKRPNMSDR